MPHAAAADTFDSRDRFDVHNDVHADRAAQARSHLAAHALGMDINEAPGGDERERAGHAFARTMADERELRGVNDGRAADAASGGGIGGTAGADGGNNGGGGDGGGKGAGEDGGEGGRSGYVGGDIGQCIVGGDVSVAGSTSYDSRAAMLTRRITEATMRAEASMRAEGHSVRAHPVLHPSVHSLITALLCVSRPPTETRGVQRDPSVTLLCCPTSPSHVRHIFHGTHRHLSLQDSDRLSCVR